MTMTQTRRRFLTTLSLASAAGLVPAPPLHAEEPPPETTTLRIFDGPITCIAPQLVARELLYGEGFTDVQYVTWGSQTRNSPPEAVLSGEGDITMSSIPSDLVHIAAGEPVVILARIP